ncbi:Rossmann-like and DUF2520 domain-containing protein [Rhodocaloribacter sp.]
MAVPPQTSGVPPRVALIGAGALGTALARRLAARGYPIDAVLSRTGASARRLAARVGAPVAAASLTALPDEVTLVLCCVPDEALAGLAERLYLLSRDWSGTTVAHTSGALTSEALEPLALLGATTLGFHPVQTFTGDTPPEAFEGIYVGLEGDARAVAFGRRLAADLGAQAVVVPAGAKALYHLAASLASNFFVTLMALTGETLAAAGFEGDVRAALMRPLVEGAWRNLAAHTPEEALTGPIARGDHGTVARHLAALDDALPHLLPVYAALATETVRVAVRGGKLASDDAERILALLQEALDTPRDPLF